MNSLELFSKESSRKFGVLVFTIHNFPLDATLWQELHKNLLGTYEGIKFLTHLPEDLEEESVQHDSIIYIEYDPASTRFNLFNQHLEVAIAKTFHNCSLDTVQYNSKTRIDITICVNGYVLNYIVNFRRGSISFKLPVDYPETL